MFYLRKTQSDTRKSILGSDGNVYYGDIVLYQNRFHFDATDADVFCNIDELKCILDFMIEQEAEHDKSSKVREEN